MNKTPLKQNTKIKKKLSIVVNSIWINFFLVFEKVIAKIKLNINGPRE